MPHYSGLRYIRDDDHQTHVIDRMLELRAELKRQVLDRKTPGSFTLATWNIRDFDSNKFGHGRRRPESLYYIAEIISTFDLVAVQEVNRNMKALEKVMRILGRNWSFIVTDTTEGPGGNAERLAFVYDKRKIWFRNIAGEIVLPSRSRIGYRGGEIQFARSPFLVAFQAGWFKFSLCTVHIYFGADHGDQLQRRIEEIERLAKFFKSRQKRQKDDFILLGDFNIVSPEHETMRALSDQGFEIPPELRDKPSSFANVKYYDQIAMRVRDKRAVPGAADVFDFKPILFDARDYDRYHDVMSPHLRDFYDKGSRKGQPRTQADKVKYFTDTWRTFQISDHLPMWVNIQTDFTNDYLNSLKPGEDALV